LGERFYSKNCWSQRFSLWWQKVLQLYGLWQEFEGGSTRRVHSPLAAWGFPPLETEHKAAKNVSFKNMSKVLIGSDLLRFCG